MNPRDRLQYALYLQRLHELFVIKENIAFEYPNAHYNKAAEQIDKVVDKCLDNNIKATVDGTHNLETPNLDHVITEALSSQQKMLVKTEDKFIDKAVRDNTKQFTSFIQNRIEKENYSLQAKIEKEYQKKKYKDLSEDEAKKLIEEKFKGHARKRAKNIVKDALHTNQSHISWTYNVNNGMRYKVWMNGQGKGRVRPWHRAKLIQPVEIDDFFDIYGSSHVQMMYPGDLNGGAENVANCRCWLYYTNIAPSNLKPRGTIQVNPNVNLTNENKETFSANSETKGKGKKTNGGESTSSNKKEGIFTKIQNKISNIGNLVKNKFETSKSYNLEKFSKPKILNKKFIQERNFYNLINSFKSRKDLERLKDLGSWSKLKDNNIPHYLDKHLKKSMKEFESYHKKFEDGNEWSMVFNLDKGKFEKLSDYKPENLYTDEKQDSVNPLKKRDFGDDELIVLHNHQDGTFLSPNDFAMGFFRSENIKYVLVHTNNCIYITKFNNKPSSIEEYKEFINEYNRIRTSSSPETSWMKLNGNDITRKYISVDMVIKNV